MSYLPLVSIGIPVYNGEDFIVKAIESVLIQDYHNIELVISDNASTDNTQSICEEYAAKYPQVKYYRQDTNQGMIANFNLSLALAHGDFFCWLSHDDFLAPTYISKCMDMLALYPRAIACCSEISFVNEDGSYRSQWTAAYKNFDALNKDVISRVRELTTKVGWYALYSLFRIDVIRKLGICQNRYPDDVLLMTEWLLAGEIAKVKEHLYFYRLPNTGKTPEDYCRAFGLDVETTDEIVKESFTYTAKQILDVVYDSNISIADKHRIKRDFIDTLIDLNHDWLGRIAREQNWTEAELSSRDNLSNLLESKIVSSKVAKIIDRYPPQPPVKALVFFPHNPYPSMTGAHRRCLEMLTGLRDLGCEVLLFSSNLYTDRAWTQESIDALKVHYGVETYLYQATEADIRYLEACRAQSQPGKMNWDYFLAPGMRDSFKHISHQFKPSLVMVSYSLWGKLVAGQEFKSVVKIIDTIDIFTLTMQMFQILTPYFSQTEIDLTAIEREVTREDFFTRLNLKPEQEEYDICDLYDYTIAISQKEGNLFAAHTQRTDNVYVPMTVEVPSISNYYDRDPLFVISGNGFNLQGASYFVREVLPLISPVIPDFKLQVVGSGSSRIKKIPELELCGFVEDISTLYSRGSFAICPLIGGTGQQVKIVEAMAHGLAVVALINVGETSPIEHGVNGFIARNAEEFARYTISLYQDRSLCQRMGAAARQTIEQQFSASDLASKLQNIVARATQVEWKVPKPQIAIDGVFFQLYNTGIARVWKSLLEEWASTRFANHLIVLDRANTAPKISGVRYYQIPAYDYNNTEADRQMLQQVCDELGADLFISTYYTTPLETPSVFMGYDMIPEVLGFDLSQPMWQEKQRAIAHASAYINISEHTAKDLVEIYSSIDPSKVKVAHCGVSPVFQKASPNNLAEFRYKYGIAKPYFIISSPGGYKNSELFLQAIDRLPSKSGFDIVVTGGHVLNEQQRQYTHGCNVHYLRLDDFELSLAYAGAIALVYPSKYEGFGLPIVEAMASGCPVITCPNASIPEVAGEAAIYVFDEDVDGMAEALCEVQKPQIRSALIEAGLEQAQKFSWTKMADTVKSVLVEQTLSHLQLRDCNLIIFPDWSADEEALGEELTSVFYRLSQHPEVDRMTLIVDTSSSEDLEAINSLISAVAMNLMMAEGIDITESLVISLTDRLAPVQWEALLPKLAGKIKLELETMQVIDLANPNLIKDFELPEIADLATSIG